MQEVHAKKGGAQLEISPLFKAKNRCARDCF